ncbi:hypothetical protein PoB_001391600 [Plakobranchus ocellatus]|uniref:Uncharacterized protein n=1 Tax=Plakobranchus ocellatus TaxID=259542 RepID=A0AAV3YJJ9_9GAST|nr:hypothetical protein PoB_001391600 [Plakobranchus ocellatus]
MITTRSNAARSYKEERKMRRTLKQRRKNQFEREAPESSGQVGFCIKPVHNKVISGLHALLQARRAPCRLRADLLAVVPPTSPEEDQRAHVEVRPGQT